MAIETFPGSADVLAGPALIYRDPSAVDEEANYGTLLGLIDGPITITPFFVTRVTRAEPYAAEPIQEWKTAAYVEATFRVHSKRDAAMQAGFPDANVTGGFQFPGTVLPGGKMVNSTYCKRWLIMPIDDGAENPVALFQFGLARVNGNIEYASDRDLIIPIMIRSYRHPDATAAQRAYSHFVKGSKATVASKFTMGS